MEKEFGLKLSVVLDKHKNEDGTYDIEKAQEDLQAQVNGFTASLKPDMEALKVEVKSEAENDFIKGLKIDNVENSDSFKAYVKTLGSSATELSEKVTRLQTENKTVIDAAKVFETNLGKANGRIASFERFSTVANKGFNKKYEKAAKSEAESRMTDDVDFESSLDLVKKDYPEWLQKKSSGIKTPSGSDLSEDEDIQNMRRMAGLS